MVGGHLINSQKEDAGIPSEGWLYEDTVGEWQNDETLTVKSKLIFKVANNIQLL